MALELSHHDELILLGNLLGYGLCRVVEFIEHVFVGLRIGEATGNQLLSQIVAEGLCRRQEDAPVAHGIALDEVEVTVRVYLIIIIKAVTAQHLQQGAFLHPRIGNIGQIDACRIALVLDVETELGLLHRCGEIVDVLHHQVPVALLRIVRGVFQRLHEESLRRLCIVAGELTHLIGLSACRKLEGHC